MVASALEGHRIETSREGGDPPVQVFKLAHGPVSHLLTDGSSNALEKTEFRNLQLFRLAVKCLSYKLMLRKPVGNIHAITYANLVPGFIYHCRVVAILRPHEVGPN
jgi:hypothetical protein